jgi:DNA-directed RNA polymerase specialized sigma24 family protein
VRCLVERAPAKLRAVTWLYHVDGFDQDQVAEITGLSRRTVATRLALFLGKARKLLTTEEAR